MSDYTPTTEEIQSRYVYAADFTVNEEVDAWGEFDRWLAAHDAEVYKRGREDEQAKFAHWTNAAIDESERAKEYQRGREDAANAVGAIESWDCVACGGLDDIRSDLIAAARGDGADHA